MRIMRPDDQTVAGEVGFVEDVPDVGCGSHRLSDGDDIGAAERFVDGDSSVVIDEDDGLNIRCDERNERIWPDSAFACHTDGVPAGRHARAGFGNGGVQGGVRSGDVSGKGPEGIGVDIDNDCG